MKEKLSDVLAFFRDPRCRDMIKSLHAFDKLSGNDLCEVMGIRYPDDVSGRHLALCSLLSIKTRVDRNLRRYFGATISSTGSELKSMFSLEPYK